MQHTTRRQAAGRKTDRRETEPFFEPDQEPPIYELLSWDLPGRTR